MSPPGAVMKVLFFGTPEVAVPFLEDLAASRRVVGVVTQPDRPSGRRLELKPSPVKAKALELGLPVFQPARPSEALPELRPLAPELGVVVAYGRLLKPDVLALPRRGCVNVHFSLLPKYRGAAPIQWALARGEAETGATVFWLDEGMDTGPILLQRALAVGPDEDAPALSARLVELGRALLRESLDLIAEGKAPRLPQRGEPSLAPVIEKEHGRLDFSMEPEAFRDRVRAFRGWPRAWLELEGRRVLVLRAAAEPGAGPAAPPGTVLRIEKEAGILIKCGNGVVRVLELQPEGRPPMSGAAFLNGLRIGAGARLG